MLERLSRSRSIKQYEEDADLLEDVIIENRQAIEMTEIYTSIVNGTMDAYASIISNNLNLVMKFMAGHDHRAYGPDPHHGVLRSERDLPVRRVLCRQSVSVHFCHGPGGLRDRPCGLVAEPERVFLESKHLSKASESK